MHSTTILVAGGNCRRSAEPVIDPHLAHTATLRSPSSVDQYPLDAYGNTCCPRLGDRMLKT